MTTKREYECNLCFGTIRSLGRGVKHAAMNRLSWTTLADAEIHLCDGCIDALQDAFRNDPTPTTVAAANG